MKGRLFMSNIYTGYGSSPAIYSMFDSKKGSLGNRIDCTAHRATNTARATAETGALGVATYAGYKAINAASKGKAFNWNSSLNKFFSKGADFYKNAAEDIGKSASKLSGVKKYAGKAISKLLDITKSGFEKLAKTTGRQKLLGALGVIAVATLIGIERKHAFKEGQYDQKYNDIAKKQ